MLEISRRRAAEGMMCCEQVGLPLDAAKLDRKGQRLYLDMTSSLGEVKEVCGRQRDNAKAQLRLGCDETLFGQS